MGALSGCADPNASSNEEQIQLKLADSYPTGHPFARFGAAVFMEEVERLSEGRINFSYFPAGQMGKAQDLPNLTRSGVIDIAAVAPAYVSEQLPLSGVADLPGLIEGSCSGSKALLEGLLRPGGVLFEADFSPRGLRPLITGIIPGYEVMTVSKKIEQPSDVQGLAMRSSGGTIDRTVEALGGAGVGMPATEMYEALLRGTVDGTVLGAVSAAPYKLGEVIRYSTMDARLGSFTMTYSMSESSFNKLSPELQEVIIEAGKTATDSLCQALQEGNINGQKALAEDGVEFYVINDDERSAWASAMQPIQAQWVNDMNSINRPGREVLEAFEQALAETSE